MGRMTRLTWHRDFRLLDATGTPVARPAVSPTDMVLFPPPGPSAPRLGIALSALDAGQEVCLASKAMVPGPQAARPGHVQCATSGSTGEPKRIRRTLASWAYSFERNAAMFELSSQDCFAVLGDPSHSLTLYAACEAMSVGADLSVLSGVRPDRQGRLLSGASVLYATPTQLRLCLAAADLPHLRLVLVGGGALDRQTLDIVTGACPNARVIAFYGASETSFVTLSHHHDPLAPGTCYPGVDLSLRDDHGNAVSEGEIWVKSPMLFAEYAAGHEPDTRWEGDWISVGEMGRLDQAGRLEILGRRNRMFTVADRNFYPEAIEKWLVAQTGVTEAVVFPVNDPRRGFVPIAVISGVSETDRVRKAAMDEFGPQLAPRRVITIQDMPLLPSGKPDLTRLREAISCL